MTHTRKRYPFNVLNIPEVSSITRDVPLFRYSVRKEKEKKASGSTPNASIRPLGTFLVSGSFLFLHPTDLRTLACRFYGFGHQPDHLQDAAEMLGFTLVDPCDGSLPGRILPELHMN